MSQRGETILKRIQSSIIWKDGEYMIDIYNEGNKELNYFNTDDLFFVETNLKRKFKIINSGDDRFDAIEMKEQLKGENK